MSGAPRLELRTRSWLSFLVGSLMFAIAVACGDDPHPLYGSCGSSSDCREPAQACYELSFAREDGTAGAGKLCSLPCSSDSDCPDGGVCLAFEGDPGETFLCYAPCEVAEDCFHGLRCTDLAGATVARACLP